MTPKFIIYGPYDDLDDEERYEAERDDKLRAEIDDEKGEESERVADILQQLENQYFDKEY